MWLLLNQVELFNHPHLLLLQVRNSIFKLPGGRLRPGESGKLTAHQISYREGEFLFSCQILLQGFTELGTFWIECPDIDGLRRKLSRKLSVDESGGETEWEVSKSFEI